VDKNGNFDFSETQISKERGRHLVMSVEITVEENREPVLVFLKIFPDMPMMDIAATELATLLVGPQLPWVELVRIHDASKTFPAIFCEGIKGEIITYKDFDPSQIARPAKKLDLEGYSNRVIVGLMLNQEDGKNSNFILKQRNKILEPNRRRAVTNESCYELVSVDNDRSFYSSMTVNDVGDIVPQVKDISFLFNEIREFFLLPVNHF
jgi:hypothetical protein